MFGLFRSKESFKTYAAPELAERLRAGDRLLVDVREDQEWAAGHIAGAVHAPLSRFATAVELLPKDKPLIFYCQGGVRSKRAIGQAQGMDLPCEGHLGGGISAWRAAGLPVAP